MTSRQRTFGRLLRAELCLVLCLCGAARTARANPELAPGVWQDITPSTITKGAAETCIAQGIAIDLQNPSTMYWGNTPFTQENGGLFKTTDAGSTWQRIAQVTPAFQGASDHLDMPLHVRIDPNDSNHLYVGDGVRGGSTGFFVSTDGGTTFVKPPGFISARTNAGIDNEDIYDVAVDPTNFEHLLLSFHYRWGWDDTKWNKNSGVMESTDGGDSWIIHDPVDGWGTGHAINFLYKPELGIGDASTWLLGTQGDGFWRTTDAGANWSKVSATNITHGGGDVYYASTGVLYAGGEQTMRSSDNGATWEAVGPQTTWTVWGDGTTLFTARGWGSNQPFMVSPETDGSTWTNYSTQTITDGAYEMAYDSTNGILYSSQWFAGLFALKLGDGTGIIPDPPGPPSGSGGSGGTGGSAAAGAATGGSAAGNSGSAGSPSAGSAGTLASAGSAGSPSGSASAGASSGGTANASPQTLNSEVGCACRAAKSAHSKGGAAFAALLLGLLLSRRGSRCCS